VSELLSPEAGATEPVDAATPEPAPVETTTPEATTIEVAAPATSEPEAAPVEAATSEATVPEAAPIEATIPESTVTAPAAVEAAPAAATPTPDKPVAPKPSAVKPSGIKPSAIKPGKVGPRPAAAAVTPAAPVFDEAAIKAAEAFGRVDADGTVYVRDANGERVVGQVPGQSDSAAISLYVRRYLDLVGKVDLFEARLATADLSPKEVDQTIAKLTEETAEPAAVGDLDQLRSRVAALQTRAAEKRAEIEAKRAAAKADALAARTAIVEAAEKLAAADPAKVQWRTAGDELARLLDQWKTAQKTGPRIDRRTEDELWKRFSAARTVFDRERRKYFAELDQKNSAAKAAKEALVAEAEKLSTNTDWGATAAAYRELMTKWKAAGRASRKDDDALWNKFRAAQDKFFAAREAANAAVDAEFEKNLVAKEALLVEAEELLPIKDLGEAKTKLRALQDKWEAAGKVPRAAMQRTEARMRAVEQAIRDAEQAQWVRTNPETRARAEGAAAQLEATIESLEADLAAAQTAGDHKKVAQLEASISTRKLWLEQVRRAAEDSRA